MGGIRNNGTWIDNAEGLDMDVPAFGKPNVAADSSPLGTVAATVVSAPQVTVKESTLASTIPADGTLEFDGTDLTVVIAGSRMTVTVS
jgi:hypothetical protein